MYFNLLEKLSNFDRNHNSKDIWNAYKLLNKYKGGNHKDPYLMSLFKKSNLIFDKTPSYIFKLDNIMRKIDVPFVITLKTFPEGLLGHCRRKGVNLYQLMFSNFTNF